MTNNDIVRSLRYTFNMGDNKIMEIFGMAGLDINQEIVAKWLKRDDDPDYIALSDLQLAIFLNGFIIDQRGRKEGSQPVPENKLTNNIILRKIKIALELKDDDIIEILNRTDFRLGKSELSAFFRNPSQPQYRPCKDQVMRLFLQGLSRKYRPQ